MIIEFGIAGPNDDAAIRRLLAENPMPGAVTVSFEREPDYFLGHGVPGDRCITVKAVDAEDGNLAGIVSLASGERFVGGKPRPVGYVGGLRVDRRYRGAGIPLRAMRYLRELVSGVNGADNSGERWPDVWFSVLADENGDAVRIFTSRPRPSFPELVRVARIRTLGILTRRNALWGRDLFRLPYTGSRTRPFLRAGGPEDLPAIAGFLRDHAPDREFFPVYRADHFSGDTRTPGFSPRDFLLAFDGNEIVGVCGVWDQSGFKQTVVHGYGGRLARLRPLFNTMAPVVGMKRLPGPGERLDSVTLCFVAIKNDDPRVFRALLRRAVHDAYAAGKPYLLAGFCEGDPLLRVASRFRHIGYRSTMYAFTFDQTREPDAFDRRKIPYVEIAAL